MKYAIIENGVVVNIAIAEAEFAAEQGWVDATGADIGYSYDGSTFTAPARDVEAEWAKVRATRNTLLAASDVAVLPDRWASMSADVQSAWSAYRQALRDIPATFSDPADVIWPTKPE
jgi:hypothetical protein